MSRRYMATLLNAHPRSMSLVNIVSTGGVFAERTQIDMEFPDADYEIGGGGYTQGAGVDRATAHYVRFHSPGASLHLPEWSKRGFGFTLYAGAAIAAETLPKAYQEGDDAYLGIYSDGHRTKEAACLWAALECHEEGVYMGQGNLFYSKCGARDLCSPIAEQVHAPGENAPADKADVLRAERIRKLGIIVALSPANTETFTPPPADALLNVRLDPEGMNPKTASAIAVTLRRIYGPEIAQTFLSRPEVAALVGSESQIAGLSEALGLGVFRRRKVPGISAKTKKLQQFFVGVP